MKVKTGKIGWNKELLKKLTRAAFIKKFEEVFPDVDLGSEYDRMFPPKPKKQGSGEMNGGEPEN